MNPRLGLALGRHFPRDGAPQASGPGVSLVAERRKLLAKGGKANERQLGDINYLIAQQQEDRKALCNICKENQGERGLDAIKVREGA
jgi:hypothetical protein